MEQRTKVLTTVLDLVGLVVLTVAAGAIWWPLALVVIGTACLLVSWRLSR